MISISKNPNINLDTILDEYSEQNCSKINGDKILVSINSPQVILTRILINALNIPFYVFAIDNDCLQIWKHNYYDNTYYDFYIRIHKDYCNAWLLNEERNITIIPETKVDTGNIGSIIDMLNLELKKYKFII